MTRSKQKQGEEGAKSCTPDSDFAAQIQAALNNDVVISKLKEVLLLDTEEMANLVVEKLRPRLDALQAKIKEKDEKIQKLEKKSWSAQNLDGQARAV